MSGDREVQRTMLELLNQLDGFCSDDRVKVRTCTLTSFSCQSRSLLPQIDQTSLILLCFDLADSIEKLSCRNLTRVRKPSNYLSHTLSQTLSHTPFTHPFAHHFHTPLRTPLSPIEYVHCPTNDPVFFEEHFFCLLLFHARLGRLFVMRSE